MSNQYGVFKGNTDDRIHLVSLNEQDELEHFVSDDNGETWMVVR